MLSCVKHTFPVSPAALLLRRRRVFISYNEACSQGRLKERKRKRGREEGEKKEEEREGGEKHEKGGRRPLARE